MSTLSIKLVLGQRYHKDFFLTLLVRDTEVICEKYGIDLTVETSDKHKVLCDDIAYYFDGSMLFSQGYTHLRTPKEVVNAVKDNVVEYINLYRPKMG